MGATGPWDLGADTCPGASGCGRDVDRGYETPEACALADWTPEWQARVIETELASPDRAYVLVDTEPSHAMSVTCERRDGEWYEAGEISATLPGEISPRGGAPARAADGATEKAPAGLTRPNAQPPPPENGERYRDLMGYPPDGPASTPGATTTSAAYRTAGPCAPASCTPDHRRERATSGDVP